jgi:hypothetical protein
MGRATDFVHLKVQTSSKRKFRNNIGTSGHDFWKPKKKKSRRKSRPIF